MSLEIQVQPHLACFDILKCNWDQDKGYIEVDFGEGRIVGFRCEAKKLEFALQLIQAFGERCRGLDESAFKDQIQSLYHRRLFCDLHKKDQENYVAIYKFDRLGKDLECVAHHFHKPVAKMYKSPIEEDTWLYLKQIAEMDF